MKTKIILNITNNNGKISSDNLTKSARELIEKKHLFGIFEIDLTFITPAKIKEINSKFLGRNYATNVLSFPVFTKNNLKQITEKSINTPLLLGGIVIAYKVAQKEAKENQISTEKRIEFLFLHGLKHLLGYHHK